MKNIHFYALVACILAMMNYFELHNDILFSVLIGIAMAVCISKYDGDISGAKGTFIFFCCGIGITITGVLYGLKQGLDITSILHMNGLPRSVNRMIFGGYSTLSASLVLFFILTFTQQRITKD